MAIELNQLLAGLDDSTIKTVEQTIKENAKELNAKLFIDGDGEHYVPYARFDEVVNQRDSANVALSEQAAQLEQLGKQVEEGSKADIIISDLKSKLEAQSKLANMATIETRLFPLVSDAIAPVSDLVGFMDIDKIIVNEDGSVTGLDEQLKKVRETRSYLFKSAEEAEPQESGRKTGTGNPGNPGNIGAGAKVPKQVGEFGKQIAQAASSRTSQGEQTNFFR